MAEQSTPAAALPGGSRIGEFNQQRGARPISLATYLSQAEKTVGPALGPLAASFVDTTLPFASLAPAAKWLGLLTNTGTGQQALITEATAAYQDWVAFIGAQSAPGLKKTPIDPFEPEEGDG